MAGWERGDDAKGNLVVVVVVGGGGGGGGGDGGDGGGGGGSGGGDSGAIVVAVAAAAAVVVVVVVGVVVALVAWWEVRGSPRAASASHRFASGEAAIVTAVRNTARPTEPDRRPVGTNDSALRRRPTQRVSLKAIPK